jgi:hypothetical protein
MAGKQKNLRLDDYYVSMLASFAERFERGEGEIVRTALDALNSQYGMATTFIERLRERHGADTRLEFRPTGDGATAAVYADGEPEPDLIGILAGRRDRRGEWEPAQTLYLEAKPDSPFAVGALRIHPSLYIGAVDWPASPAAVSIAIGALTPDMQEYAGLIASRGRPRDHVLHGPGGSGVAVTDEQLDSASEGAEE